MKSCLATILLLMFIFPAPLAAVDYVYTMANGNEVYTCGHMKTGRRIKVKEIAKSVYMVRGGLYYGKVHAGSFREAARVACGEIDPPEYQKKK